MSKHQARKVEVDLKAVPDLFEIIKKHLGEMPTEDKCHQALHWLLEAVNLIKDQVLISNFQQHWLEISPKILPFADPSTFRFHQLQIEQRIDKVIDPEVRPLKVARR